MTIAPFVQILGRGPGRARSLTQDEACAAMNLIMQGKAAPEAVGAMLMLMRMKGEVAAEIAGFVQAIRTNLPIWGAVRPGLDWPSYAAGRTRGRPWFLLSAKLVAQAGVTVLLHGWNSDQGQGASVRAALPGLGISVATSPAEATGLMARDGISYLPLETLSPMLLSLLQLRSVLGLRSCINTALRVMNPGGAAAAVQGVFHPAYRELQMDAGALLGQHNLTILKGGGGEFERHPGKDIALYGLRGGQPWELTAPALVTDVSRLDQGPADDATLAALWNGHLHDPFATAIICGTAALALATAGLPDADAMADTLWNARQSARAA